MRSSVRIAIFLLILLTAANSCGKKDRAASEEGEAASSSKILTLDAGSMDAFLAAGGPAIIEFGGKRCLPCMEMRKTLDKLGELRKGVRLGIVYWEDNPELFEKWKVGLIPAQIVFDGSGREVTRHRGSWELDSLLAQIDGLK
ncbi:MAG: thioredoxin family protein [Bacteroidota bacterium]